MDYQDVLNSILLSEIKARELFIKTAEYHKSEPGIYYDCQNMSSLSDDNIRIIKSLISNHSLSLKPNDDETSLFPDGFYPGNRLADNLVYLLNLKRDTEEGCSLLLNSSLKSHRINAELLINNSQKQSGWLSDQIKAEEQKLSAG